MKLFLLVAFLALTAVAPARTCRLLFLAAPEDAPEKLHLFDGRSAQEVELPRLSFSRVYQLPPGDLRLRLLPAPPPDPAAIPAAAPAVTVAEAVTDCYLLVSSDPANPVAPVRLQLINANPERLKRGQMLWFNLTDKAVGGSVGSGKLALQPNSRATLDPPARGATDYPVTLAFRIPGDDRLYPLCETRWLHDPRSRCVVFIIPDPGARAPRVLAIPDYRETPDEQPEQ